MKNIVYAFISGSLLWTSVYAGTYVVSTTADTGLGSLRAAMTSANGNPGSTITFAIGSGVQTITPATQLPIITADGTTIDGTSQPGWAVNNPVIVLSGSGGFPGFEFHASNCTIQGLVIGGFSTGIQIDAGASFNTVYGCFIGTDQTGTVAVGNGDGIMIASFGASAIDNTVVGGSGAGQRNIISGNGNDGIEIEDNVFGTIIQGNYIGVDATGSTALGNGNNGIEAFASDSSFFRVDSTQIGGTGSGQGNIISANVGSGINFSSFVINSIIQGNFIGTDATGTASLGNGASNIFIQGTIDGPSTNNLIGGTLSGAANTVVNSIGGLGIDLEGPEDVLNPILGNSSFNNAFDGIGLENGANDGQSPPQVNAASLCSSGNTVLINATAPNNGSTFRLEFFVNVVDRSPITEGQRFIGAIDNVASGDTVTQTFVVPSPAIAPGSYISATATNLNNSGGTPGDTSPFSSNVQLTNSASPSTVLTAQPAMINSGGNAVLTATITGTGPYDLVWSDGFTQTGVSSPAMHTVSPTTTTTYFVDVTDEGTSCTGQSSDVTVTVNVGPISPIIAAIMAEYPPS